MPIYEYVCQACGRRAEVIQKVDDPPPAACAGCGLGPMARQVSRTSFQLKGGGWYADLYGSTPAKPAEGGPSAAAAGGAKAGGEGTQGGEAPKGDGAKASSDAGPSTGGGGSGTGTTATPAKPASAPKPGGSGGGEG